MQILEVKRHLNKPDQSFLCDLLTRGKDYLVLKYVSEVGGKVGEVTFEIGSTTYAYYKTGLGYVLWKMSNPGERLAGYLFHICRDLQVADDSVEYLDMLLDVWIYPTGEITILDRDEVEECVEKGVIGERELNWIARQEQEIILNWSKIIADFDQRLSGFI